MNNRILPTFIIPGAAKSGTSYVMDVLAKHKEVFVPCVKEPGYFSNHAEFGTHKYGLSYYQKQFAGYDCQNVIGEASQVYFIDPASPKLIYDCIPQCKLIFILRDPVLRMYSNYWQAIKTGRNLPVFDDFIANESVLRDEMLRHGKYNENINRYLQYFSEDQILIMQYELMPVDRRIFFEKITRFLGIEPIPQDIDIDSQVNPASSPRFKKIARVLRNHTINRVAKKLLPKESIPHVKQLLVNIRSKNQVLIKYEKMSEKSENYLSDYYEKDIACLENKVDVTLWRNA